VWALLCPPPSPAATPKTTNRARPVNGPGPWTASATGGANERRPPPRPITSAAPRSRESVTTPRSYARTTLTAMRNVIAGAHGQIGLRLVRLLAARSDEVIGLIRNPDHAADIEAAGGAPVVCDLEHASTEEVAEAAGAADVAVFAAGAGGGSGAERKLA